MHNALAAAAAALSLDLPLAAIRSGLESFKTITGRLEIKKGFKEGVRVIDDSYNANPASMEAALKVLSAFPGQRIFVMGDMFELGDQALELHQAIGKLAKRLNIDRLIGVGELTQAAVQSFGKDAAHFSNKPSLIEALNALINNMQQEVTILVKGSRGMRMEEVVGTLTQSNDGRH